MITRPKSIKISDKRRKKTLVTIGTIVSLSVVAIGIGFAATTLASGYNTNDLYKQTLCTGKALEFAQKGVIRDVGGFNGAIYECTHMKYADSIYGDVVSAS
jgi:hypothetical protein